jgi:hypothetical protein
VMRHEILWSLGLELAQAILCRMSGLRLLNRLSGKLVEVGIKVVIACRKITIQTCKI